VLDYSSAPGLVLGSLANHRGVIRGLISPSIWDHLKAQSLLGVEGFAEGLRHLVTEKQTESRDTEGTTIRRATDFEEAIFTEEPEQTIEGPTHRQSCRRVRL
jgi:hypothetical protein